MNVTPYRWVLGIGALVLALPTSAYEEVRVTDGAVIEGRVSYDGRIPTRRIVPTSDREVCGGMREWQLVERGTDNGIRNAIVYLEAVERGKSWPEALTSDPPVLDNHDCMFDPLSLIHI